MFYPRRQHASTTSPSGGGIVKQLQLTITINDLNQKTKVMCSTLLKNKTNHPKKYYLTLNETVKANFKPKSHTLPVFIPQAVATPTDMRLSHQRGLSLCQNNTPGASSHV